MLEFLEGLYAFVNTHGVMMAAGAVAAQWVFSAIVTSMPPLPENASYNTKWFHAVLQTMASNLEKAREVKGSMKKLEA